MTQQLASCWERCVMDDRDISDVNERKKRLRFTADGETITALDQVHIGKRIGSNVWVCMYHLNSWRLFYARSYTGSRILRRIVNLIR